MTGLVLRSQEGKSTARQRRTVARLNRKPSRFGGRSFISKLKIIHSRFTVFRSKLPGPLRVSIALDSIAGCGLGVGAGIWAVSVRAIENTESTDLYALAGAAVGLLAIALAVLALLTGFLTGRTAAVIRHGRGSTDEV